MPTTLAPLNVLIIIMHDVDPKRFGLPSEPPELKRVIEFLTGQKVRGSSNRAVKAVAPQLRRHLSGIAQETVPPSKPYDLCDWLMAKENKLGVQIQISPLS